MFYLTEVTDIEATILQLANHSVLWLDTEVAAWQTSQPKLSLIQAAIDADDLSGTYSFILDVLDRPALVQLFIDRIMRNPNIEKVFHNANYDLRFLGGSHTQNVTCTLKLARQFPKAVLGTSNYKLKTLAKELCDFTDVDAEPQSSDWGQRPLSDQQLLYAKMDTVYLAQVHQYLLRLPSQSSQIVTSSAPMNTPLSVTNVRVAFECARLFYLTHHFGGKTLFQPNEQAWGIGNTFHKLSERFIQTATEQPQFQQLFAGNPDQLEVETIASKMQDIFFTQVFYPYLQTEIAREPSKATALQQLWQGLTGLIERWAKLLVSNRYYCSVENLFSKTFLAQELHIEHLFMLPEGNQQLVRGRFDNLVYDFKQRRLSVVEYKTYQSLDSSAQLAQVALYSYMLKERIGVEIDSAVYSVLPEFKELIFSANQLDTTVHQLIPHRLVQMQQWVDWQPGQPEPPPATSQPYLCTICPQQTKCQTFFPTNLPTDTNLAEPVSPALNPPLQTPSLSNTISKSNSMTVGASQVDALGETLIETLRSFGVEVSFQGIETGPAFIRVKLKPALGVKVSSILKLSNDLKVQLGIASPPMIAPQAGYVSVDLPRPDRQPANFDLYFRPGHSSTAATQIAIGVNLEGQLVEADLSDPNTCHFLVAGTTGSGKSEFLRSLLLSLLMRHSPRDLQVALVDPKRVTFPEFERMPWLYTPVAKDSEQAIDLMQQLVAEMNSRYQEFEIHRCHDLSSYNQLIQQPDKLLPRIVCIFDEFADFMAEKATAQALEQQIKRLGAMARAAGIHLIITTQRPEARVVTPIIRSNLPGRIALRTASEADSMIILGGKQTEAASLLGKGDLLYQVGANLLRLQGLFAPSINLSKILHT